jgi:hypothetical protein
MRTFDRWPRLLSLGVVSGRAACRSIAMKSATAFPTPKPARPRSPPRARGVAQRADGKTPPASPPGHEERVREAAYFIYERSGRVAGREVENWLEAEALLLREGAQAAKRETPAE